MMGYQRGLEDARGTLFYEFARLVREIQPKVFIYENVQGLLRHDGGKTWEVIQGIFDSLGYHYDLKVLNSKDFGIPQNRERLFLVSILKDEAAISPIYNFPSPIPLDIRLVDMLENSDTLKSVKQIEILEPTIKVEGYLFPSGHSAGRIINIGGISPTVMDNHGSVISIKEPFLYDNGEVCYRIRKMTNREYFRLMGVCDSDIDKIENCGICKSQQYKLAGNSIVVDVLYHIFLSLFACSL
jgi:DNA (cytosine-5)-methyltransferase 1